MYDKVITYELMKNLLHTYSKDIKCVVSISLKHVFKNLRNNHKFSRTTFSVLDEDKNETLMFFNPYSKSKYLYSNFKCYYFDHDDLLCKVDEKIMCDIFTSKQSTELNNIINSIKEKSYIADKKTTIIDNDENILKEKASNTVVYISKFDNGTPLKTIIDSFNKNNFWYIKDLKTVEDLLMVELTHFEFNVYADNPSKDDNVFDYIRLTIPVIKRNNTYDEIVDFIKNNIKEVNNTIFKLISSRLKKRNLPVNILDFKNSKMVLTRQMELVFTVSVKELEE